MNQHLFTCRERIDALDYLIIDTVAQKNLDLESINRDHIVVALFAARITLVKEIAAYKQERGLPPFDAQREEEIFASRCAYGEGLGLSSLFVRELFTCIINESHRIYNERKETEKTEYKDL